MHKFSRGTREVVVQMQRFFGRGSEVLRFFSRGASSSAEKVQKCWCKLCDSAVCRGAEVLQVQSM